LNGNPYEGNLYSQTNSFSYDHHLSLQHIPTDSYSVSKPAA